MGNCHELLLKFSLLIHLCIFNCSKLLDLVNVMDFLGLDTSFSKVSLFPGGLKGSGMMESFLEHYDLTVFCLVSSVCLCRGFKDSPGAS